MQTKILRNRILHTLLGALLLGTSQWGMATPCGTVLSHYSSGIPPSYGGTWPERYPECFGASSATATVSINQSAVVQTSAVSSALATRFLASPQQLGAAPMRGVAASVPGKRWNVWGSLTDNTTKQSFTNAVGNAIRNDTDGLTTTLGGDHALSSTLVAGVSVAFDRAKGDSYRNGTKRNELVNKGYMVAPYVGLMLSKSLALDAALGFGEGELSQTGNVSAEADRWFVGANLNYTQWFGNTQLSGRLGWLHAEEDYDDASTNGVRNLGTAARSRVDQFRLGGQAAWWMNGVMPYVGLAYVSENRATTLAGARDPIGRGGWQWSLGANFVSVASGVTGGIAYQAESGRSNQKNRQLLANVGLRF